MKIKFKHLILSFYSKLNLPKDDLLLSRDIVRVPVSLPHAKDYFINNKTAIKFVRLPSIQEYE